MPTLGIDPGSTILGAGLASGGVLAALRTVRPARADPGGVLAVRTCRERLAPLLALAAPPYHLAIEVPPPTMSGPVVQSRSGQAAIGWAIGTTAWMTVALWQALDHRHTDELLHMVPVRGWRAAMMVDAGRRGIALDPVPSTSRRVSPRLRAQKLQRLSGGCFRLPYGCGHFIDLTAFANVKTAPGVCEVCTAEVAEDATTKWKRRACTYIKAVSPDLYAPIVAEARGRAKSVHANDWTLAGVADACEGAALSLVWRLAL